MKKVSIVFTTSTSDSKFPFLRLGFGSINLARQSQELKLNLVYLPKEEDDYPPLHALIETKNGALRWGH